MNSRVCVDAEARDKPSNMEHRSSSLPTSSREEDGRGNVVLVLPPKDTTNDDSVPVMVNNVPVFISRTSNGSPLYIRQYAPTLEEIMDGSPEEVFDGFSEASGQTFEGFSEGSCASVQFEGFNEGGFSLSGGGGEGGSSGVVAFTEGSLQFEGFVEPSDDSKAAVIQSLMRIITEKDESKDSDEDLSSETCREHDSVGARSSGHKRKRLQRKYSPEKHPQKKVKQEVTVDNRHEVTKTNLPKRRISVENLLETSLPEPSGKVPRNLNLPSSGDPDYIGEFCNAVGCTVSFLERMAIKDVKVTNGIVSELADFATRISWEKDYVVRWIQRLSGLKTTEPMDDGDYKSIQAVLKRRKALSTIHSGNPNLKAKLKSFDMMEYVLPSMVVKQEVKVEDVEVVSGDEKASNRVTKREGTAEKERDEKGARKGAKRLSHAEEIKDSEVKRKGETKAVDESKAKEEKERESRTARDTTSDHNKRRDRIKEVEEKDAPQKKNHASDRTLKEPEPKRRMSTRRASLLAVREEQEKPAIKQEQTDGGSEEISVSRSGRIRILPRFDREKQRRMEENKATDGKKGREERKKGKEEAEEEKKTKEMEENKPANETGNEATGKTKEEEVSECEEEKIKDSVQAATEATPGRRVSSRRASLLKAREEEKSDTKPASEKVKNSDQRQRREPHRESKPLEDCKTEVGETMDLERKTADERRKRRETRRESVTFDKPHSKTEEVMTPARPRTRRDSRALLKQEEVKPSPDSETTQKKDKARETETISIIRTRRSSLFAKEDEEGEETKREESDCALKGRLKETARKPVREGGEGRRTRRGSLMVAKLDESRSSIEEKSEEEITLPSPLGKDGNMSKPAEVLSSPEKEVTSPSGDEGQFILKRNKVINRDKRISRWQNKQMAQHEAPKTPVVETITTRDSVGSGETKGDKGTPQNTSADDFGALSDDGSDRGLVIDEGDDSMPVEKVNGTAVGDASVDVSGDDTATHIEDGGSPALGERKRKRSAEVASAEDHTEQSPGTPKDTSEIIPEKSPIKEDLVTTPVSHDRESAYAGTLGISKSGRLRKPSAKGIQSIEIKCLFMQRNGEAPRPPPPLPLSKDDQKDKDWVEERRSPVKREPRESNCEGRTSESVQDKQSVKRESKDDGVHSRRSPVKAQRGDKARGKDKESPTKRRYNVKKGVPMGIHFNKTDNEFLTYTYHNGHLVPKFRERDVYLGDYCAKAGLTVEGLNSEDTRATLTFGIIRELYQFYVSRKATKTALAIKLFKLQGKTLLDNTHLLSTVMRITNLAKMKHSRNVPYDREFVLPVRIMSLSSTEIDKAPSTPKDERDGRESGKSPSQDMLPQRVRRGPKKRGVKPEDSGDEYEYFGDMEENADEESNILVTRGQEGSITRGDIVFLYSKWLSSKMSEGSNTFVTDLLRSVEQLMAERNVAPLRIPAGTLMSSSVKLYDEYKQILRISKEDAIMYLQEDWLEDIQYLLSISAPSRRNTSEGEAAPGAPTETDAPPPTPDKPSKTKAPRHRSGNKDGSAGDSQGESPASAVKEEVPRSHQMESVGKRLGKRRNFRESLDKFEKEILEELEKSGDLEEEEEDALTQIEKDQSFEDPPAKEETKVEKKRRERKRVERSSRRDIKPADHDSNCEVKKIIDYQEIHDSKGKRFRYLVRWVGFRPQDDSWVDEANLQCPEILAAFWKGHRRARKTEAQTESQGEAEAMGSESLFSEGKEEEEGVVQVMVKQALMHHTVRPDNTMSVTKRELLDLYDTWRQENQDELMAGGTNTVNVQVFKSRVKDLMAARGLPFYPESILNAAFMMTLMRTRLQNQVAINKFLDSSCLEVLEVSHKQHLRRKYSEFGTGLTHDRLREQKPSVLSLQKDLHSLKLDLATAQKWRSVKNSQLGAIEEEVNSLEVAMPMQDDPQKTADALLYLKQEVHKLKCDLKVLERNHDESTGNKQKTIEVPLFSDVTRDPESFRAQGRVVRDKLLNMNMAKSTVDTIMDIVARRIGGRVQE